MNGKTHTAVGCAAGISTLAYLVKDPSIAEIGLTLLTSATAATIPDIDNGSSKKLYRIVIISMFASLASILLGITLFNKGVNTIQIEVIGLLGYGCFMIFGAQQPHRGFTHSIFALILSSVFIYLMIFKIKYRNIIILAYVTSYLSHLIIDIFNCKGAQYLFPLKDRYCLKLCKSGSTVDKVFGLFGEIIAILVLLGIGMS